jgi:DNA primase
MPVAIVEGFFDAMKVHQADLLVIGLIGSSLSEEQELLLERFKYLIPFLDGDAAGRAAAAHALPRLARRSFIRVVELPEGQPDQLTEEDIRLLCS